MYKHNNMLCETDMCTGCGACMEACPQKNISMQRDSIGTVLPYIDEGSCVQCGLCNSVCHVLNNKGKEFQYPQKAYVGYAKKTSLRQNGASGGIATAIYEYALKNDCFVMGTKLCLKNGVAFFTINCISDLEWAGNSKYVWSDLKKCYKTYENELKSGRKCIFIGLPCQTSALKTYLSGKKVDLDKFFTVELICHGVPNWKMLDEHVKYIERKKGKKIEQVKFRERSEFYFICKGENGEILYNEPLRGKDEYYKGFTAGLILRDSCYRCKYAKQERQADLTIGDYPGIGEMEPYVGDRKEISAILINSEKGLDFVGELNKQNFLCLMERPVREPVEDKGNPQLRKPMKRHGNRMMFVNLYGRISFEKAIHRTLYKEYFLYYITMPYFAVKKNLKENLSEEKIELLKKILRRNK